MNKPRQYRGISIESGEWVYGWYACRDFDNGAISHYIAERLENSYGYVYYVERELRPETVGQSVFSLNGHIYYEGDDITLTIGSVSRRGIITFNADATLQTIGYGLMTKEGYFASDFLGEITLHGSVYDHLLKEKQ